VVIDNAVAYLEAKVIKEMDVGTHTIFIGELIHADVLSDEACMTYAYYHLVKRGTIPRAAPVYHEDEEKKEATPKMVKYKCKVCGYIYDSQLSDPDGEIKPGTPFEELPGDWVCPVCGANKSEFERME
jgi:rubredoxin